MQRQTGGFGMPRYGAHTPQTHTHSGLEDRQGAGAAASPAHLPPRKRGWWGEMQDRLPWQQTQQPWKTLKPEKYARNESLGSRHLLKSCQRKGAASGPHRGHRSAQTEQLRGAQLPALTPGSPGTQLPGWAMQGATSRWRSETQPGEQNCLKQPAWLRASHALNLSSGLLLA